MSFKYALQYEYILNNILHFFRRFYKKKNTDKIKNNQKLGEKYYILTLIIPPM